jgi:uncharacterized protein YkwD
MGQHCPAPPGTGRVGRGMKPAMTGIMVRVVFAAMVLLPALVALPAGAAGLVSELNTIRLQGCQGRPGARTAVRPIGALDEVARELSRGGRLKAALERGNYEAASSASIHIEGSTEISVLRRALRNDHCAALIHPAFSQIGVFQRGKETWIVLADPFSPPDPADQDSVARQVLALVNAAREKGARCGRKRHAATQPVVLSAQLSQAASAHARDMAAHSSMSHRGSDGSQPAERVTRAGYRWRNTAENVAAGQPDADSVVAHWLNSPGHCATIMGAQFTEMGVAFAVDPDSDGKIYWAQVFATPQ